MACNTCSKCALATLADGKEAVYKQEAGLDGIKWYKFDTELKDSVQITDTTDLDTLNAITTFLSGCDGFGGGSGSGCTPKSKSESVTIGCDTVVGVTDNGDGTYTWVHNLNILNLNQIMSSPYPVVGNTANSTTFRTSECAQEFIVSIVALGSEDCVNGAVTPPVPPVPLTRYMFSPVPYKFNVDLNSAYQKPTDAELEAYDTAMNDTDTGFRAQRDAHSKSMVEYVGLSHVRGVAKPTSTVTCMPDNIGIMSGKAKHIDLAIPEGVKTSYYGFPYDMVFKPEVANIAALPAVGSPGDIRYVENEGYYYWHRSTNTWENDSVALSETVNGVTLYAEDFLTTNRTMRDAWMKAVNQLFISINILKYADDYLPSFQINKYKI